MTGLVYFLFFCSGLSGLIYQVVWVRQFGNVFGNTIYSASLVVAVFMLGLGAGSYLVGIWADRRYATSPDSLLRAYGYAELAIALLGAAISALLPHLGQMSALVSSYARDGHGWYVVSPLSYLARTAIALVLLTPITLVMGGTLTLLIRHLVRKDVEAGGLRIAFLYGMNTAGAALGCLLTDLVLVPAVGLRGAQLVAVTGNLAAAGGAWLLVRRSTTMAADPISRPARPSAARSPTRSTAQRTPDPVLVGVALASSGFAAMGMEIVWFRHFSLLLGGFRAVFSVLLTVILVGIGAGSILGGLLHRYRVRPVQGLMAAQACFVASTLVGLARTNVTNLAEFADRSQRTLRATSGWARLSGELWFNVYPMLLEVGVPALLMGFAFPLANAVIQHAESSVGRRAGVLYLFNTAGAVAGATVTGFLLLPAVGSQWSAAILMIAAWLAVPALYLATRTPQAGHRSATRSPTLAFAGSTLVAGLAVGLWLRLPANYLITRAMQRPTDKELLLTLSEGVNEVIAVTEGPDHARELITNGHPMASTKLTDQRYMRALAHIPLLSIDNPETALVIGFGVGNTAHAATLHPSIRRVEVADLSEHVLRHAPYFAADNHDVLADPRVFVYVNDGRQHLLMQRDSTYDLITLEPPPIAFAGVGALYSREFYQLARTRLKANGYVSQWLPIQQVPPETALSMIRAFVEVFPNAVLLSGTRSYLQLIGSKAPRTELDPTRMAAALARAPAVRDDLTRLDLGRVREIAGMFLGSAETLVQATREVAEVTDDRPLQEYGVRSVLVFGARGVPSSIIDLSQIGAWCPACFVDGTPHPVVDGLDAYLGVLGHAYMVPVPRIAAEPSDPRAQQMIRDSTYLTTVATDAATARNDLGAALASQGRLEDAMAQFREALRLRPQSEAARRNLATAERQRADSAR